MIAGSIVVARTMSKRNYEDVRMTDTTGPCSGLRLEDTDVKKCQCTATIHVNKEIYIHPPKTGTENSFKTASVCREMGPPYSCRFDGNSVEPYGRTTVSYNFFATG